MGKFTQYTNIIAPSIDILNGICECRLKTGWQTTGGVLYVVPNFYQTLTRIITEENAKIDRLARQKFGLDHHLSKTIFNNDLLKKEIDTLQELIDILGTE